jgi:hypothetical protein
MDKVRKLNNSEYYTPSSEPFRIYLTACEVHLIYEAGCILADEYQGHVKALLNDDVTAHLCDWWRRILSLPADEVCHLL